MCRLKYAGAVALIGLFVLGCPPSDRVVVPDVRGLTQVGAMTVLAAANLTLGEVTTASSETVASGMVISQDPAAGSNVDAGTAVDLVISSGPAGGTATVPDLSGMVEVTAAAELIANGLTLGEVTFEYSDTVGAGGVISQDPAAGADVGAGTSVDIVISLGPQPMVGWSYTTPDNASCQSIEKASDGGYLVSGRSVSGGMYGMKITSAGARAWDLSPSRVVGSHEHWAHPAFGMVESGDGGYVFLGQGSLPDDGIGTEDAYVLVKYGVDHTTKIWEKAYSPYRPGTTIYCGPDTPVALEATSDGGFAAMGSAYIGPHQATVLKTDSLGNLGTSGFVQVIDTDNDGDYAEEIEDGELTSDGGYVMAGWASIDGYRYALIIKVNSDGSWDWTQKYQDTNAGYGAYAYAVTQKANGHYLVTGELVNDAAPKDLMHGMFVVELDEDGNVEWSNWNPNVEKAEVPEVIKETPEGGFVVGGQTHMGEMKLTKFASNGTVLWNLPMTQFGSKRIFDLVVNEDDGSCVVVGVNPYGGATTVAEIQGVFVP